MKILIAGIAILLVITLACNNGKEQTHQINQPIAVTFNLDTLSQDPEFKGKSVISRIQQLSSEMARKRPAPKWEVTEMESVKTVKQFEIKFTERVNRSLSKYTDKVEGVQNIVSHLGKLSAGVLNRNPETERYYKEAVPDSNKNLLNVIVYGEATYKEQQDVSVKFVPELGVVIPGIHISDQRLYDSVLAHECYHGYRFLTDPQVQKSTRPPETLSLADQKWFWRFRAREEINAYAVGRQVLNVATNDEYQKRLTLVVERKKATSLTQLFDTISQEDLELVDSVLNPGSNEETMNRCFVYLIDLGVIWIAQNTLETKRAALEEELYMAFSGNPNISSK